MDERQGWPNIPGGLVVSKQAVYFLKKPDFFNKATQRFNYK